MEWTSNFIRIWFFSRDSAIPSSLNEGSPDPREFGIAAANYEGSCDIDRHFSNHSIIFDTTFCGDYAGPTFDDPSYGCPLTENMNSWESCVQFVANNPESFTESYWRIKSMRVYQQPQDNFTDIPSQTATASRTRTPISSATPTVTIEKVSIGMGRSDTVSSSPLDLSTGKKSSPTAADEVVRPGELNSKVTAVSSLISPVPKQMDLRKRALSAKRGLVHIPSLQHPEDDDLWTLLGSAISWYHNYGWKPSASLANANVKFVPMLWGNFQSSFQQDIRDAIVAGETVTHILSFNEPDMSYTYGGSNIDPVTAAAVWQRELEPLYRDFGIQIGAPAVTGQQSGFTWLEQFFRACAGKCTVGFLPLHWYGDFQGLASHIGQARGTYLSLPIWLTEFAYNDQPLFSTQTTFNQSIQYMDRLPYVDRYSYFGSFRSDVSNVGPNAAMLDQNGSLTEIGRWYLNINANVDLTTVNPSKTTSRVSISSASPTQRSIPVPSSTPLRSSSDVTSRLSSLPTTSQIVGATRSSAQASPTSRITCPSANNTVVSRDNNHFIVECYIDREGYLVPGPTLNTDSFDVCMNSCSSLASCVGFAWAAGTGQNSGVGPKPCYLKSFIGESYRNITIWGARLLDRAPLTPTRGSTTRSMSSVQALASTAVSSSQRIPTPSALACPNSNNTLFRSTTGATFQITCGVDHFGGDMGGVVYVADFPSCVTLCSGTTGCLAAAYTPGGACYRKSIVGEIVVNSIVSGAVCVAGCSPSVSAVNRDTSQSLRSSIYSITSSSNSRSLTSTRTSLLSSSTSSPVARSTSNSRSSSTTSPQKIVASGSSIIRPQAQSSASFRSLTSSALVVLRV